VALRKQLASFDPDRTASGKACLRGAAREYGVLLGLLQLPTDLSVTAYSPVDPSICSRNMSACPAWRAVSSIMWMRMYRRL
jgi:hypothetical protein